MPYIEYLFCEKCGNRARLDIDHGATIDAYNAEGRKSSFINQATIVWDYLIYSCEICESKYKYTYRDVELRVREYFSALSPEFKKYIDTAVENAADNEGEVKDENSLTSKRVRAIYAK